MMKNCRILFWNVDTQKDFIEPDGKLYVAGAESIRETLSLLTKLAKRKHIQVVNTADYHFINSAEISKNPDMVHTFPEHCMAGATGAEFINETDPDEPLIFDWDREYPMVEGMYDLKQQKNILIRKDDFDVFKGNRYSKSILEILAPEKVVVYGVTTNVCVHFAVAGLVSKSRSVYVVEDAIKELPNIPLPYKIWERWNVHLIKFEDINTIIKN
jgi:nicotinamidase/pyrazinamidase